MNIINQILSLLFLPNCPTEEGERPDYFKQWVRTKYGVYHKVAEQLLLDPGDPVLIRSYARLDAQIRSRFSIQTKELDLEEVLKEFF